MKSTFSSPLLVVLVGTTLFFGFSKCQKGDVDPDPNVNPDTTVIATGPEIDFYLTEGDQTVLFEKQPDPLRFRDVDNGYPDIVIDTTEVFQTIDGFGFTLTDGSAQLIDGLREGLQSTLLRELFGSGEGEIGISYLRISIGASDLSASVYTYDDMPAGETDVNLDHFDLRRDQSQVIPVLQKILDINPDIQIMGSPWTAPVWMKDNESSIGGSLLPEYYGVYANYFVRYIQAMKLHASTISTYKIRIFQKLKVKSVNMLVDKMRLYDHYIG